MKSQCLVGRVLDVGVCVFAGKCVCGPKCPEQCREQFTPFTRWLFLKNSESSPKSHLELNMDWPGLWCRTLKAPLALWLVYGFLNEHTCNMLAVNRAKETFFHHIFSCLEKWTLRRTSWHVAVVFFFPHPFNPKYFYGERELSLLFFLFFSIQLLVSFFKWNVLLSLFWSCGSAYDKLCWTSVWCDVLGCSGLPLAPIL